MMLLKTYSRLPMISLLVGISLSFFLLEASRAHAQEEYTPPAVPKLYQKATPDELAAVPERVSSHFFVGGAASFGQSRSTGGESPSAAYGTKLEFGYNKVLDSWSRFELGMSIGSGVAGHSKADLTLKPSIMANFGYGYSLGGEVIGIVRGGVGAVFANYEDELEGLTRSSTSANLGTAVQLAYAITMPLSARLTLHSNLAWTHLAVQIRDVKFGDSSERLNKPMVVNVPSLELGLRVTI